MLKNKFVLLSVFFLFVFTGGFFFQSSAETIITDVIDEVFNYDLYKTSQGEDVLKLQKVLNFDGDTVVSCSGSGSLGNETSYFGPATEASVIKFQNKYNILPSNGYVGQETRLKLNKIYRCFSNGGDCKKDYPVKKIESVCKTSTPITTVSASDSKLTAKEGDEYCRFIDNLILTGAIKEDKAAQARAAAGKHSPTGSCTNTAFVDLKVNGKDSTSAYAGFPVNISWTSSGVNSCMIDSQAQNVSGNKTIYPSKAGKISIFCKDAALNQVSDSVQISFGSNSSSFSSSSDVVSYNATSSDISWMYSTSSSAIPYLSSKSYVTIKYPGGESSSEPEAPVSTSSLITDSEIVMVMSEVKSCGSPLKNHDLSVISLDDKKPKKYIWVMGESQLIDNMGGAIVGNVIGGENEADGKDATYKPMLSVPVTGQVLVIVPGEEVGCSVYGKSKKILRAYMTVQGKDWVEEQESGSGTSK
ncbi:MAG: peptidoglycan-binding domain-containing protein [Candidatus Paceibacterota bacterium]|jgi:hypothetical protein